MRFLNLPVPNFYHQAPKLPAAAIPMRIPKAFLISTVIVVEVVVGWLGTTVVLVIITTTAKMLH